jgi:hypothetical protein
MRRPALIHVNDHADLRELALALEAALPHVREDCMPCKDCLPCTCGEAFTQELGRHSEGCPSRLAGLLEYQDTDAAAPRTEKLGRV